jgi:hypothetical protein
MASGAVKNSFLSLVDCVASGKPVVTRRHEGLDRLVEDGLPARFYDVWSDRDEPQFAAPALSAGAAREQTTRSVHAAVASILEDDACLRRMEPPLIAFAHEKMDIYRVLWTILRDQIS